jgi:ABC-type sugar transport system ATPase subunit
VQQCTVAENLFMPDYPVLSGGVRVDWPRMYREAEEILQRTGLNVHARTIAGDIGIGMQQIVLMLKASYVERSEIIILDEAFASLSEREEELFYGIMRERSRKGVTMLRDGHSVRTVRRDEVDRQSLSALIVGTEALPGAALPAAGGGGIGATPRDRGPATPVLEVET